MNAIAGNELGTLADNLGPTRTTQALTPSSWEALCGWLTQNLRGMEVTIERQEGNGEWVVECLSFPLESVRVHRTANDVQVLSISVRMNGSCRLFEVSGPNSIRLHRNAAGWPIKVELGYQEGRLVLLFSGQMEPQKRTSSNAWGE